jgi:Peptidase family M28
MIMREMSSATRAALVRVAILIMFVALLGILGWSAMIRMPGNSYTGPLPPLSREEVVLIDALRCDVNTLAGEIGERNVWHYQSLLTAGEFIAASLKQAGYEVRRQEYKVGGRTCSNLEVEVSAANQSDEIVIVGAHYDSALGSTGANDNATGTASMLALARNFAGRQISRNLRFVAFVNEEPPHFQTEAMGSLVYAQRCRQRGERVVAMLSLETIGYYSDEEGSQSYPAPLSLFYPTTGNFICFVGNLSSRRLTHEVVASFRVHAKFPSEAGALPAGIPGVGWSDHWAFWQQGYPAIMVTDTALCRYPQYHSRDDTPDIINYEHLARVVAGLERVVEDLVK